MEKNAYETAEGYLLFLQATNHPGAGCDCEVVPRGMYECSTYTMPSIPVSKIKLDVTTICSLLGISFEDWWILIENAPSNEPIKMVERFTLNGPEQTRYSLLDVMRFINQTSRSKHKALQLV